MYRHYRDKSRGSATLLPRIKHEHPVASAFYLVYMVYTCSAPHPPSASLMLAGGSIEGMNSRTTYPTPWKFLVQYSNPLAPDVEDWEHNVARIWIEMRKERKEVCILPTIPMIDPKTISR